MFLQLSKCWGARCVVLKDHTTLAGSSNVGLSVDYCSTSGVVVVLTVGVVVRGVVVVPNVLVRREVRGVLLQAAAARHVAQPVAVGAVAAAAAVARARAAAAEHRLSW